MQNTKPIVAFVHLPLISYKEIFDLGATNPQLCMPLGILYLSSMLKEQDVVSEVFCIDYAAAVFELRHEMTQGQRDVTDYQLNTERYTTEVAQRYAAGRQPDVIAVSLTLSTSAPFALEIIPVLSRLWPDATVIFGGNHSSNDVQRLVSHPDIDFVARGEAEIGFPEFIRQLGEGRIPTVVGIIGKRDLKLNGASCAPLCAIPEDLDALPFPDWSLIDMPTYQGWMSGRKRDFVSSADAVMGSMMTTRGCPYSCTFCSSHSVHGRKMRYRSIPNVLAEMKLLNEHYGVNLFVPEDDLFTVRKDRTVELLAAIQELGIPGIEMQFPNALSVNTLDEEVIDALVRAGMRMFSLAVESGSPHVQKELIKKRVKLDRAKRLVDYATSKGLYTRVNFIIGFPGETREMVMETVEYARTLGSDWCVMQIAVPLIGSEMFEQFDAMGVLDHTTRNWEHTYWERGFDTPEFKAEEIKELCYRANLDINFIHNRQMQLGQYELAIGVFEDIVRAHPFHLIAHYQILNCLRRLGRMEAAEEKRKSIIELVANVKKAREMLEQYRDILEEPDFLLERKAA